MLELSESLQDAVAKQHEPAEVIDPRTQTRYVLVKSDVFEHLQALAYDDSPWSDEEKALLADESARAIGWDEMDEYDNYDRARP
jgi:hypothetical protein